ncbi:MAG: glycosyltransferase family 4 protein, partial [Phycisphaerae bacterium]
MQATLAPTMTTTRNRIGAPVKDCPHGPRIALLASYVPRRCGIATFSNNLARAICRTVTGKAISTKGNVYVAAMNDVPDGYDYPEEVGLTIDQHRRDAYRDAADIINTSRIDAVCIQHEYGLFGGEAGEYVLDLVTRLSKPVVTTLHTLLTDPSDKQRAVLGQLCQESRRVVVMAERARLILSETYGIASEKIQLIHHGVPDVPAGDTEPFKERFGLSGRPVILTFGLLSPGKSIEVMLDALAKVVPHCPDVAYIVLGVTHPGIRRESGEQYRLSLETRALQLGIQKNVLFHNRYVTDDDLKDYLQAADLYVTPYRAKEQITSGTLAYALAAGKPIVSTPYWHAEELLADGRGRLFDFGDSDQLAQHLRELLSDTDLRHTIRRAAYEYGRRMTWSRVSQEYVATIADVAKEHTRDVAAAGEKRQVLMRISLPEPRLDHLYTMTDDTGMLQHATYATPNRAHGYCTDDNARALIVTAMAYDMFKDEQMLPYLNTYLSFLHFAAPAGGGRFRNFMSYDRRWFDHEGSDDCQGRTLWALGYLIAHAPGDASAKLAIDLFQGGLSHVDTFSAPRAWALTILGLYHYLRSTAGDQERRATMEQLADRLYGVFSQNADEAWPWFEDVVTYDNGRLPQAMIVAGFTLDRRELVDRGLNVLRWLLDIQSTPGGNLSVIGNNAWFTRQGERARF